MNGKLAKKLRRFEREIPLLEQELKEKIKTQKDGKFLIEETRKFVQHCDDTRKMLIKNKEPNARAFALELERKISVYNSRIALEQLQQMFGNISQIGNITKGNK